MDEISYNLIMQSVKKMAEQTSLLFCAEPALSEKGSLTPEKILKEVFGYKNFRPLQKEIIKNILDGRDTLAVLPTGGGKSLCYQIPALMLEGITIVISPLISLMQDQVEQLKENGIDADFLNSSLDYTSYILTSNKIKSGKTKILFLSPEGFRSKRTQELLHSQNVKVSLIAIDEAHCISEWGHDFRPDYLEIATIRKQFPKSACLALTASATAQVRKDIIKNLGMESPAILISSFNRPNIFLTVEQKTFPYEQVLSFIQKHCCFTQEKT